MVRHPAARTEEELLEPWPLKLQSALLHYFSLRKNWSHKLGNAIFTCVCAKVLLPLPTARNPWSRPRSGRRMLSFFALPVLPEFPMDLHCFIMNQQEEVKHFLGRFQIKLKT